MRSAVKFSLSAKADVSLRRILGSVSPRTLCDGKKSCQARNSYIEAIKNYWKSPSCCLAANLCTDASNARAKPPGAAAKEGSMEGRERGRRTRQNYRCSSCSKEVCNVASTSQSSCGCTSLPAVLLHTPPTRRIGGPSAQRAVRPALSCGRRGLPGGKSKSCRSTGCSC
jgi:hypothetical protein